MLVAVNAENPNWNSFDFACYISKITGSGLTAIFLENIITEKTLVAKKMYEGTYIGWEVDEGSPEYQQKMKLIDQHIEQFEKRCVNNGITAGMRRYKNAPDKELIDETRFADVLVLDPEISFNKHSKQSPTGFTEKILEQAECPVLIAPHYFHNVEDLIFAYDGSKSAVFAIKQFMHLFPEFNDKKMIVLQVEEKPNDVPEMKRIEELLKTRYTNIQSEVLRGRAVEKLFKYLLDKKNSFVIMGAYGRGPVSTLFKHSTAELMIKAIDLPIFIAHL